MLQDICLDDAAPWKQRYRAPMIPWTQLAKAAPTRGLAVSNRSGVYQLYAWDVPTGVLQQLTDRPEGTLSGGISPDGRSVYYLEDQQGNELGHFVRVPFEGGTPQDLTPHLAPYATRGGTVSQASNLMALTLANAEGHHLCCLEFGPEGTVGTPRRLYQSHSEFWYPVLSHRGECVVIASTARTSKRQFSLLAFDTSRGTQLAELYDSPQGSLQPIAFSPLAGDFRLLATTNRTGFARPLLWNPYTGERTALILDDLEGALVPLDWSPDGERLLLCQFAQAVQQLYLYELMGERLTRLQHPRGTLWGTSFGPQGEIFAHWQDATHPPRLIALDGDTGLQRRTVLTVSEVPPSHPWRSITFTSSDGQTIQGWLGLPEGAGPFPAILKTHGGPFEVETERFSPESQAWLDHGFAYLTINYRGSITFGRAFQEQIWGHPGHWEIEDLVAARAWLIEQRVARADQLLLTGWSYGGYLTLLALGKRPDLWAGGMAGIATADWVLMYEDAAETLKAFDVALCGGTPQEKREQYVASSPITYAAQVTAPVLMIQGRHDTRCPPRQAEMYEAKRKALGKSIEVHWFDAGHMVVPVEQNIVHQERMLRFAYRVLT